MQCFAPDLNYCLWSRMRVCTLLVMLQYSLLGIMGVSIPVLYGEGANAFQRLQDEILRTGSDDSIFAFWWPDGGEMIGTKSVGNLLSRSPDDFRGCGNIITYNKHVSTGYHAVFNEVKFRQRVLGQESFFWKHLLKTIQFAVADFVSNGAGHSVSYHKPRLMILRCGLEHEPGKILVLRLLSIDSQRPDLYVVDRGGGRSRLETRLIDVHGYDSCPYKTFSVLREPNYEDFQRNGNQEDGNINIVCVSQWMLDIKLKSMSHHGTWDPERRSFLLSLENGNEYPYFDAELEIRYAESELITYAKIDLWPSFIRGTLRMRFDRGISLPIWTTAALFRNANYCTFIPAYWGLFLGRAYPFKNPVQRNDILFLQFDYLPLHIVLLHACRRVVLCIPLLLLITAILPFTTLGVTIWWILLHTRIVLIWIISPILVWFLSMGVLCHLDKMSLEIFLAVPFGLLGGLCAAAGLVVATLAFMPIGGPNMWKEFEDAESLLEDSRWEARSLLQNSKVVVDYIAVMIKWYIAHLL